MLQPLVAKKLFAFKTAQKHRPFQFLLLKGLNFVVSNVKIYAQMAFIVEKTVAFCFFMCYTVIGNKACNLFLLPFIT